MQSRITTLPMFDGQVEEAIRFYTEVFDDSRIQAVVECETETETDIQDTFAVCRAAHRPVGRLLATKPHVEIELARELWHHPARGTTGEH